MIVEEAKASATIHLPELFEDKVLKPETYACVKCKFAYKHLVAVRLHFGQSTHVYEATLRTVLGQRHSDSVPSTSKAGEENALP